MMRLWPGWVCQPVVAMAPVIGLTGGQTLLCTYRSEGPLVFCNDIQTSPGNPTGSESLVAWLKTSNSLKVPVARVVALKPEAAVARTFFEKYRAVNKIAVLSIASQDSFRFIGISFAFRAAAAKCSRACTQSGKQASGSNGKARDCRTQLRMPLNAVLCRYLARGVQSQARTTRFFSCRRDIGRG